MFRPWTGICAAVALAAAVTMMSLLHAQEGAQDRPEYEGKTLNAHDVQRRMVGQPIAIKDHFDQPVTRLPRDVERRNVTTRRFAAFRARDSFLLCVVNLEDEDSMATLQRMAENDAIYLVGEIRRLGTVNVFAVEEIYRGHSRPPLRSIVLTLSDANERNQRTFRLREAGQKYRVRSPYDDRILHVSFQLER